MDIDKFIDETCFYDDFIDISYEYTIEDIKDIVSKFPSYWEDATSEDFEELLNLVENYIQEERDYSANEELADLEIKIQEILSNRIYCTNDDIMRLLLRLAYDYSYV